LKGLEVELARGRSCGKTYGYSLMVPKLGKHPVGREAMHCDAEIEESTRLESVEETCLHAII
jgi:hypothetical protein